jgi:hypothetical protein
MKWEKRGFICGHKSFDLPWFRKNMMVPTPHLVERGRLRLFTAMCDEQMVGRIGYVDVNPDRPDEVLGVSERPVLDIGEDGTFDDNGVLPSSLLQKNGRIYLFYLGYQLGVKVPYTVFSSIAVSDDGGESFRRISQTPVFERRNDERYMRSCPTVVEDNGIYRAWYLSGNGWILKGEKKIPMYDLKYMESRNILRWDASPASAIELRDDEYGITKADVEKKNGTYNMIYSVRSFSKGYRLGYAESKDCKNWKRMDDHVGIDVSKSGFDDQMICYATRYKHDGRQYLFYCGNGYGLEGIGYAELLSP